MKSLKYFKAHHETKHNITKMSSSEVIKQLVHIRFLNHHKCIYAWIYLGAYILNNP